MKNHELPPADRTFQFDLQALLWLTTTIGLSLAFLRTHGGRVVVEAFGVMGAAGLLGLLIGWLRHRLADVVYCSVVGAIVAFMSVTGAFLPHWTARYAWVLTGAITGTVIGSVPENRPTCTILAGTIAATAVIGLHAVSIYLVTGQALIFDVICASLAGAIFAGIVVVFRWFEKQHILRRDTCVAILMLLVLAAIGVDRYLAP